MEKKFKATIRIPTEMYAYIEVEVEGTASSIVELHNAFMELYKKSKVASKEEIEYEKKTGLKKGIDY